MPLEVGLDGLASLGVLVVMRDGQGCSSLTLLPMQRCSRQDRVLSRIQWRREAIKRAGKQAFRVESWRQRVKQEEQGYGCYWGEAKQKPKSGRDE